MIRILQKFISEVVDNCLKEVFEDAWEVAQREHFSCPLYKTIIIIQINMWFFCCRCKKVIQCFLFLYEKCRALFYKSIANIYFFLNRAKGIWTVLYWYDLMVDNQAGTQLKDVLPPNIKQAKINFHRDNFIIIIFIPLFTILTSIIFSPFEVL